MQKKYYEQTLYPLQDKVLALLTDSNTPFYLTGGTALSRFYLHHRYSDDLDFFINRDGRFADYVNAAVERIKEKFPIRNSIFDTDFARVFVVQNETELKIEFINDVTFHYGGFEYHNTTKVDNPLNILSNKLSALSRNAPKDFADILFLSLNYRFNWIEQFTAAKEKDAWVNEVSAADILNQFEVSQLNNIYWIEKFDASVFQNHFKTIAKDILMGVNNSLYVKQG